MHLFGPYLSKVFSCRPSLNFIRVWHDDDGPGTPASCFFDEKSVNLHKSAEDSSWLAVFFRSVVDKLTYFKRCTCCVVLLLLSTFLNIIFNDSSKKMKISNSTFCIPFSMGDEEVLHFICFAISH